MKYFSIITLLALLVNCGSQKATAEQIEKMELGNKVFKAGAASLDVSPFLGSGIVGNYGTPPEAETIHDPLLAKALVLDDGNTRLAIVIVDNLGIHAQVCQAAKQNIAKETGIRVDHILIAATHTHSGPSVAGQGEKRRAYNIEPFETYANFLIRKMVDATKVAVHNLRPARIGFGSFDKPEHVFNRRWEMQEQIINPFGFSDSVMMNPGYVKPKVKPAGPIDPEIAFIAIETKDGAPIAVLANYSLHYVGGVPKQDISADYYGAFAKHLTQLLDVGNQNNPFVGIMTQGTSADINNINFSNREKVLPPYEKMELVAEDIAKSLAQAYQKITFKDWVPLKAAAKIVTLQVRKATPDLLTSIERVRNKTTSDTTVFHPLENIYVERLLQHEKEYPDQMDVTLQAIAIGDIGVGAIPFEVFAETGLELKRENPFKNSFTLGIANGYWGYLPTPRQHKKGGYETWLTANKVEIEASEILKEELLKLFKMIK